MDIKDMGEAVASRVNWSSILHENLTDYLTLNHAHVYLLFCLNIFIHFFYWNLFNITDSYGSIIFNHYLISIFNVELISFDLTFFQILK